MPADCRSRSGWKSLGLGQWLEEKKIEIKRRKCSSTPTLPPSILVSLLSQQRSHEYGEGSDERTMLLAKNQLLIWNSGTHIWNSGMFRWFSLFSLSPVGPWVGTVGVAGALPATVAGSPQTDAPSPASPSSPYASTHPQSV